jgi:hemin uptake protein HemP
MARPAPPSEAHSAVPPPGYLNAPTETAQLTREAARPAVLLSADLLGSGQAVEIEHNGQRYRLQTTRAGKLILTK